MQQRHALLSAPRCHCAFTAVLLSATVSLAAPPTITNLGLLPGGTFSRGGVVSPNGLVVTGYADINTDKLFGDQAFRWTQSGGMINLGVPTGLPWSAANSINDTGSAVAGNAGNRAFRWTQSGGMQNLGLFPGGTISIAFDLSGDASTVVGYANNPAGYFAFKWTSAGGMQNLGTLPGGNISSAAFGISSDGTQIVGNSSWSGSSGGRACRWNSSGVQNLGVLFGGDISFAFAISDDNLVITGESEFVGDESAGRRAIRWTSSTGMVGLGVAPGHTDSYGYAINQNGSSIAGRGKLPNGTYRACLWTPSIGMVDLNTYLPSLGLSLTGWILTDAQGITADGSAVSGTGTFNGQMRAFLVRGIPCSNVAVLELQPAPQTTCPFTAAIFDVSPAGSGSFTYQWQRETVPNSNTFANLGNGPTASWDGNSAGIGAVISGATTSTLTITADTANNRRLAAPHAIRYRVVVTNNCGNTNSTAAKLTVCAADFDCDGFVSGLDYDAFVAAFESGSWLAEFDGDGLVTGIDFDLFVAAFESGC